MVIGLARVVGSFRVATLRFPRWLQKLQEKRIAGFTRHTRRHVQQEIPIAWYSPAILDAGSLISLSLATMLARFVMNKVSQKVERQGRRIWSIPGAVRDTARVSPYRHKWIF